MKNIQKNGQLGMKKAFTLLELLIVIAILGLIASQVIPAIMGKKDDADRKMVCTQMHSIENALDMFKLDNGMYPDTEEGLKALVSNPDADKYPGYSAGAYMKKVPKDSWRQPIQYINNGNSFELISFGADRKEGGDGVNADIKYSQCNK